MLHESFTGPEVLAISTLSLANARRLAVLIVVIQCKADLERDLIVRDLAVFDMAARLHHLEPANRAGGYGCDLLGRRTSR